MQPAVDARVERVPLARLHPATWNPRTLSEERFQNLCKSIKDRPGFMDLRPILAMRDGTIFGGNQRYRACESLGWTEVPVIFVDVSEAQAKELALVDNNSWGDWDRDQVAEMLAKMGMAGVDITTVGFSKEETDMLLAGAGINDGTVQPKAPPTPAITFEIVFDTEEQKEHWYAFMRGLKQRFPMAETLAERLDQYLLEAAAEE